jgi:hypothetical protein
MKSSSYSKAAIRALRRTLRNTAGLIRFKIVACAEDQANAGKQCQNA